MTDDPEVDRAVATWETIGIGLRPRTRGEGRWEAIPMNWDYI